MIKTILTTSLLACSLNASATLVCINEYDEQVSWYVRTPVPSLNVEEASGVVCAASGDELAYIKATFSNIPQRNAGAPYNHGHVILWQGDAAVFILSNL